MVVLLGACASGSGAGTRTVRVILGHLRFAPNALRVEAGTTVTFVLVNGEAIDHEFVVGPEEVQQEHAKVAASGEHGGHGFNRVAVPANKTVRFEYTFDQPGTLLYGCHVEGHYEQGMRGTVTVAA